MALLIFVYAGGRSDRLKAGEISPIEITLEETEAAKARLDVHREKRRERHAKKSPCNS